MTFESDDLQLAYKDKAYTVQCVSIIKETLE